jgi:hypothetical protein
MPYSQFNTLHSVRQQLGVKTDFQSLFSNIEAVPPSAWLLQTLEIYTKHRTAFFNEKSRSEGIVFPILAEVQKNHNYTFSLYSGANIDGNKDMGLNGECDFILSRSKQRIELERPIFCVVEAKDNDLDLGIPQCIAQLCGARLFNEKVEGFVTHTLCGAVTTGTEWTFMTMTMSDNQVVIDNDFYTLYNLPQLLGALHHVVKQFVNVQA